VGKINVLSFDVANLIAAGEVVDRPSSVIKELLENAIDSGADTITIEIKNGGVSFMRVSDNGCGIEYDDLPTSILRHATSKIREKEDLDSIMTLGFRGEALAAIAAVSKLRIMSKTKGTEFGGLIEVDSGKMLRHMQVGCQDGTTVIVEDIFHNVPARKKFLKKDSTETAAISAVVEKIALSHPEISFRYIADQETKYLTSGDGNLKNSIYAVLGRDYITKTIPISRDENGILITGYISTPELVRSNRNLENFYINHRFVKSKTASAAIEQAYLSYIPSDKFPFCILNIEINPTLVDVNVHPSKLEVKFSNEKIIFDAVYYAAKTALSSDVASPEFNMEKKKEQISTSPFIAKDPDAPANTRIVFDDKSKFAEVKKDKTYDYSFGNTSFPRKATPDFEKYITNQVKEINTYVDDAKEKNDVPDSDRIKISQSENKAENEQSQQTENKLSFRIVGELFNTYVIVEYGEKAYIIDKHAAHERIIFEDLKAKMNRASGSSQMLLMPIKLTMTTYEIGIINDWDDSLKKIGFSYTIDNTQVNLHEIPSGMDFSAAGDFFTSLVTGLDTGNADAEKAKNEFFEKALYQASCKAAIKGGKSYDESHVKWICEKVLSDENIRYCPHGRPVAFEMSKSYLEKRFERTK